MASHAWQRPTFFSHENSGPLSLPCRDCTDRATINEAVPLTYAVRAHAALPRREVDKAGTLWAIWARFPTLALRLTSRCVELPSAGVVRSSAARRLVVQPHEGNARTCPIARSDLYVDQSGDLPSSGPRRLLLGFGWLAHWPLLGVVGAFLPLKSPDRVNGAALPFPRPFAGFLAAGAEVIWVAIGPARGQRPLPLPAPRDIALEAATPCGSDRAREKAAGCTIVPLPTTTSPCLSRLENDVWVAAALLPPFEEGDLLAAQRELPAVGAGAAFEVAALLESLVGANRARNPGSGPLAAGRRVSSAPPFPRGAGDCLL